MELITKTVCLTKHIGVNGNMFGGEVMSLLDVTAAAYATEICKYPKMVTLKVNETLFKKSIKVGHLIMVYGEVKGIGNTSITIKLEVHKSYFYLGRHEAFLKPQTTHHPKTK